MKSSFIFQITAIWLLLPLSHGWLRRRIDNTTMTTSVTSVSFLTSAMQKETIAETLPTPSIVPAVPQSLPTSPEIIVPPPASISSANNIRPETAPAIPGSAPTAANSAAATVAVTPGAVTTNPSGAPAPVVPDAVKSTQTAEPRPGQTGTTLAENSTSQKASGTQASGLSTSRAVPATVAPSSVATPAQYVGDAGLQRSFSVGTLLSAFGVVGSLLLM